MGRKKRDISYILPFCYYCDATFKNEITLHQHQKSRHFTCLKCRKKFSTADSLKGHRTTAHKEALASIPNALQNRDSTELKIFGMQGVPRQYIQDRMYMGAAEFWKNFIQEKENKRKKEARREKQALKEAQKQLNQERHLLNLNKEQVQQTQVEQQQPSSIQSQAPKPIKFNINIGQKLKIQEQTKTSGFEEEDDN